MCQVFNVPSPHTQVRFTVLTLLCITPSLFQACAEACYYTVLTYSRVTAPPGSSGSLRGKPPRADGEGV